jgi:hypothetical protein
VTTTSERQTTKEAASRVQSAADRSGTNKEFAARMQSAADRREAAVKKSK